MIRLIIRRTPLGKAGKQGLVAVKKLVSKKGKTFEQTFYVKPGSQLGQLPVLPAPKLEEPDVIKTEKPIESVYNLGDGFYLAAGGEKITRVPDDLIHSVHTYKGFKFVVHPKLYADAKQWGPEWNITEVSTGLGMGITMENAEDVWPAAENKIDSYPNFPSIVDKATKITALAMEKERENTEDWSVKEPPTPISEEEFDAGATEIWEEHLEGEDGGFTLDQVKEWLKDTEGVDTDADMERLKNDIGDEWTLERAIIHDLTYAEAESREEAIAEVVSAIENSEAKFGFGVPDYEAVSDWAAKHEENLVNGIDLYNYGVSYEHGDEAWTAGDVLAYAIENDISADAAQEVAETSVQEEEAELQRELVEDVDFTDSVGKEWTGTEIQAIGEWVRGKVKGPRSQAKWVDEQRRAGERTAAQDEIVAVVEQQMTPYEDILYRGTGNREWTNAEPGDIVPFGMASFSKSDSRAHSFGTVMLVLESDDVDNPIMGVDIDRLIADAREEGYSEAISQAGVDEYSDEVEVLVRAPALMVTKKEGDMVYVKPMDMKLLEMMKAKMEDRIARLERTFDYALHREPEGAFI